MLGSASKLERTLACPVSNLLPQREERSENAIAAAKLGVQIHRELEENPQPEHAGFWTIPAYRELALVYHGHNGTASVVKCREREYGELSDTDVPGTADVVIVGFSTAEVWDFKTGSWPVPAKDNAQLTHLALCLSRSLAPRASLFVLGIQRVRQLKTKRTATTDIALADRWVLEEHEERVQAALKKAKVGLKVIEDGGVPQVNPGLHCKWCPAKAACPAMGER